MTDEQWDNLKIRWCLFFWGFAASNIIQHLNARCWHWWKL